VISSAIGKWTTAGWRAIGVSELKVMSMVGCLEILDW
jgi:hypothetical protein